MPYLSPSEPLDSWLPTRLAAERDVLATGRAVDAALGVWSRALSWRREPPERPARALLVVSRLRASPGAGLELAQWVERGGLVVEVVSLSHVLDVVPWLFGLEPRLRSERRAALRTVGWARAGLRELEQWGVGEPDALAVTIGRYYPLGASSTVAPRIAAAALDRRPSA